MSTRNVLGIDIGASNGRAVIGRYSGKRIEIEELHRFHNIPVTLNTGHYWDVLRLFNEIKKSIGISSKITINSIGIDTWGVDFGLIDENGYLLENPHHYRDPRTESIPPKVYEKIPEHEIFVQTGMNPLQIVSLFQLVAMRKNQSNLVHNAKILLLMPDLFRYFLTGEKSSEYTIAATSLLFDPWQKDWITTYLDIFDIPHILPQLRSSGEISGTLIKQIAKELNVKKIPVIRLAGHDTASAILSVPSTEEDVAYINCGTWSVVGANENRFLTDDAVLEHCFNNEMGYDESNMFVKNIIGLWVLQECMWEWEQDGHAVRYDELNESITHVSEITYINVDSKEFNLPGKMTKKIQAYAKKTGQFVPQTKPQLYKTVWTSLALKYHKTIQELEALTGKRYSTIHIIGGGARSDFLCQLTADVTKKKVISGPYEATVAGNILVQLLALGELKSIQEMKQLVMDSFPTKTFETRKNNELDELYQKYTIN